MNVFPTSPRRRVMWAAAVVILLLFWLRPGASRLKSRIARSISAALARPVEIGSVQLRILPRPGFDLENLKVYDDPVFGSEPMLRAGEVTADLRLISLLRGRIEISRLDLTEPSLNLVLGPDGRWNLEALLERTAQMPLAPTAKGKAEARPGFPYIEGSLARINFKVGPEKKPYALTNADFSLWQDSENIWGVRLKAQPFRSDLNLSDTGALRLSGNWQRSPSLRETPLQFKVEWDGPQLGQLTRFLTGRDKGWRGAVQIEATLTGTPSKLQISSDASIRDFHRYDISGGKSLRLAAHCDGEYSSVDRELQQLSCRAPIGDGLVHLSGEIAVARSPHYDLQLSAEHVPASSLIALAQHAKKNLPDDLVATGTVEGSFSARTDSAVPGTKDESIQVEGDGEIADLRLSSAINNTELTLGNIPLRLTSDDLFKGSDGNRPHRTDSKTSTEHRPGLEFGPFSVVGGSASPSIRGWANQSGFSTEVNGQTQIAGMLALARLTGLPGLATKTDGVAQVDLHIAGSWTGWVEDGTNGFSQPQIIGTAKLRNVHTELRGIDGAVEISSADLQLAASEVRVTKLIASAASTIWTGSLELPRGCGAPGACVTHFDLKANEIGLTELSRWVNSGAKSRPWYKVLASSTPAGAPFLARVRASGTVFASRLRIRDLTATKVSAKISLERGKLDISDLQADFLGGKYKGEWHADLTAKLAAYTSKGSLTEISLAPLADAMKDPWIDGTASGNYEITAGGRDAAEFWKSAEGSLQFEMRDGTLPHISLTSDMDSLKVERFRGRARLHEGEFDVKDATLESMGEEFQVKGNASLNRDLDLELTRNADLNLTRTVVFGYSITGTVVEPRVVQVANPETQAKLKP